jgi:translation elongation factor EF-Ts
MLTYIVLHERFKSLCNNLLNELIEENGLTRHQFDEMCFQDGTLLQNKIVRQVRSINNFEAFKRLMMLKQKS